MSFNNQENNSFQNIQNIGHFKLAEAPLQPLFCA